jgi:hypothetical protein
MNNSFGPGLPGVRRIGRSSVRGPGNVVALNRRCIGDGAAFSIKEAALSWQQHIVRSSLSRGESAKFMGRQRTYGRLASVSTGQSAYVQLRRVDSVRCHVGYRRQFNSVSILAQH